MEMKRRGKGGHFQGGTFSLKTINLYSCFYLVFLKIYSRKNELRFSKQNTHKLKDLELFKVLWTNY